VGVCVTARNHAGGNVVNDNMESLQYGIVQVHNQLSSSLPNIFDRKERQHPHAAAKQESNHGADRVRQSSYLQLCIGTIAAGERQGRRGRHAGGATGSAPVVQNGRCFDASAIAGRTTPSTRHHALLPIVHHKQKLTMQGLETADELVGDVLGLTAVVTGPTSGIGEATAAVLSRNGAHGALGVARLLVPISLAGWPNLQPGNPRKLNLTVQPCKSAFSASAQIHPHPTPTHQQSSWPAAAAPKARPSPRAWPPKRQQPAASHPGWR